MSSSENANSQPEPSSTQKADMVSLEELTAAMSGAALQPDKLDEPSTPAIGGDSDTTPRLVIVYTRKQALNLSKSPLVKVPDGMPQLKDWFGESSEHTTKKEIESPGASTTSGGRRYRRDAEDGETPARTPFRSALTQPSQMGNFKHQSLRAGDRERDTERDLRTLSDKYDREKGRVDRLGIPSNSTLLRNRDREPAPHIPAATSRVASSGSETLGTTTTRRGETTGKKRNVESSEDWRRGAEPPRPGREERGDNRRDRDDRERPRSRVRDSSRQRASPPLTRRERGDRDRDDKDRDRRPGERDRDWELRRDRDRDRFAELDEDPRRWRDDGKRDERLAQRRDKDRRDKGRDRDRDDKTTEKDQDNGWTVEGDARAGKRNQRDRRHAGDDRDDKREKEKEPAWMETYVPSASTPGILGGKAGEDEVDSIQAWKKDMKERELKEKGGLVDVLKVPVQDEGERLPGVAVAPPAEPPLDEIQLFKLMMKREEHKRSSDSDERTTPPESTPSAAEATVSGLARIREGRKVATNGLESSTPVDAVPDPAQASLATPALNLPPDAAAPHSSPLLVTLLGSADPSGMADTTKNPPGLNADPQTTRLLPLKTAHAELGEASASVTQFDPPRQSRLLAFAKSAPQPPQQPWNAAQSVKLPGSTADPLWTAQQRGGSPSIQHLPQQSAPTMPTSQNTMSGQLEMLSRLGQTTHTKHGPRIVDSERSFSPFENASRLTQDPDGSRELMHFFDTAHASGVPSVVERMSFASPVDNLHQFSDNRRGPTPPVSGYNTALPPIDPQTGGLASNYATGKGSRFAKFFDGKTKDGNMQNMGRGHSPSGLGPATSLPSRQDSQGLNNSGIGESRNFGDILAMLNNSAQAQRANHQLQNHGGYSQNPPNLMAAQQQQQQQQMIHNQMGHVPSSARHDPMFEVDDGRFVADGMVPGLRPVPAPRSRDSSAGSMYLGQFDEPLQYTNARLAAPQQRNVEQMYSGPLPPQFANQGGVRGGIPNFQQPQFRGGPSPISNYNPLQATLPQRLPPGLANLGGRPPHEPSQYMGGVALGMSPQNVQQSFNQFQGGGLAYGGAQQQLRGPPGGLAHLGNPLGGGVNGVSANVDFRQAGPSPAQLLALGSGVGGAGMRGNAVFNPHHGPGAGHVQGGPILAIRQQQQQQQHLPPPHMMQQMMPPQMQPHGLTAAQHNQNDLMALLMGGAHRE